MTTLHDIIDNFDEISNLNDIYLTNGLNPGRFRPGVPYLHNPKIISLSHCSDDLVDRHIQPFVVDVRVDQSGIDKYAYEILGDGYLGGHTIDKNDDMNCEVTLKKKEGK